MRDFLDKFFHSNDWLWRLLRTIAQGIIAVTIANIDVILGGFKIDATMKPIITMGVMSVLSPIMAEFKSAEWDAKKEKKDE